MATLTIPDNLPDWVEKITIWPSKRPNQSWEIDMVDSGNPDWAGGWEYDYEASGVGKTPDEAMNDLLAHLDQD